MSTHATVIFTDNWEHEPVPERLVDGEVVTMLFPSVGISEVRTITNEAHRRPSSGGHKLIVIRAASITIEAQQAFLKTLEEPPASTSLHIMLPVSTTLLPTITSRVQVSTLGSLEENEVFKEWLQLPLADRLARIEQAAKQKDDMFFLAMSRGLRYHLAAERRGLTPSVVMSASVVLSLLRTRGASNKMLLEELALSLPVS